MCARFAGRADGIDLVLDAAEVAVLRDLAGQIDGLLSGGAPEPGTDALRERLFPRAYLDPTADSQETEFQSVVHEDLVRTKSESAAALRDALDAATPTGRDSLTVSLDREAVERWVGALNDIRLALGVTLGVTEDMDDVDPDDPRAPGLDLYDWLTWLQGSLVDVLLH
jgi:hypothetical protein